MKIKSYFADAVSDAVQAARREMGEDAMLMQTRKSLPESQHLGAYEVVFASTGNEAGAPPPPRPVNPEIHPADMARLSAELSAMRRQIEGIRMAMRSGLAAPRWLLPSSALADVFSSLVTAEISGEVAQAIVDRLHGELQAGQVQAGQVEDERVIQAALAAQMERMFAADATLGFDRGGPRIAALVGPPGSGKTTTLVKLAVAHGLSQRKPVQLISLDYLRVGAADQLRSYAAILGAGFQAVETPVGLAAALEENRGKSLILIDTPGYCLTDMEAAADLAQGLTVREEIDVHLVLSASMKSADLTRVVEAFQVFQPSKLLFTKLDETDSFGPIFCEAARTHKALSFFATGQRIPEDLTPASTGLLIELILRDPQSWCRQAA
jgi:flagellar biosynthesis protein FlhF